MQILVMSGLDHELSVRVGRAPRFTVALGPERSLNSSFISRFFREISRASRFTVALGPERSLNSPVHQ
jgi:hypothetical protein